MNDLPDDLNSIIETADRELQAEDVPPHARPIHAVMKVARALGLPGLPLVPLTEHHPEKDSLPDLITQRISSWYQELYGDRLNLDPSANARVAIIADGDIWEGNLPIIFGGLVAPSRKLPDTTGKNPNAPKIYNPCAHLTGITQARLNRFTNEDINEVVDLYNLGHNSREAFKRFRNFDPLFVRAEADWAAATLHLTAQRPDYGQSLYSSYQVAEKFMKGIYKIITNETPTRVHGLGDIFKKLKSDCLIRGMGNLEPLLVKIPYNSSARYEAPIDRSVAYHAHKSSLELVGQLGTVGYSDYHQSYK
ncbi:MULTISPECIES: HEPN domain-containing protein [Pacificibacter]|uniref:HEPN domain-containing protein n=1 Tax=Pacificibacter TaxID=1042323 RepID=UPI001C095739|nr:MULTISPECIES: HEPN domain-containing protein [Pacificibacter]MBU2935141.1 HEPN domain-containing protein [Pacificibacter marinus]MDO6615932.1 HEPN domain-containing protein [Pacificibacter sp. 1_MG-2023]